MSQPTLHDEHVALERAIRSQFDAADAASRPDLYQNAYDQIYSLLLQERAITPEAQSFGMQPHRVADVQKLLGATPQRVLDVGCGSGYLGFELLQAGHDAHGIDVSRVVIGQARAHAQARGVNPERFQVAQALTMPYPDASFDLVTSNQVLEHLHADDLAPHLREVRRVLRPGGRYLAWTPEVLRGPVDLATAGDAADGEGVHLNEMTLGHLTSAMRQAGFRAVRVQLRRVQRLARYPLIRRLGEVCVSPALYIAFEQRAQRLPMGSAQRRRWLWLADLVGDIFVIGIA